MSTGEKYGVPLSTGGRGGILQPLGKHRWRLAKCEASLAANAESVQFDFVKKLIHVKVRSTIDGNDFEAATAFSENSRFKIDAMDGSDGVLFVISPNGLKPVAHDLEFTYKLSSVAMHEYTFKYDTLTFYVPDLNKAGSVVIPTSNADFPTPAEAMAQMEKKGLTGGRTLLNEDDDLGDNRIDGC